VFLAVGAIDELACLFDVSDELFCDI